MPSDLTTPIPEKLVRKFGRTELAPVEQPLSAISLSLAAKSQQGRSDQFDQLK
jgi:hypothetical protein